METRRTRKPSRIGPPTRLLKRYRKACAGFIDRSDFADRRACHVECPSRLPARPSGLWGLTAQRSQAKGPARHQCRTAPARAPLKLTKRTNVVREKPS